MRSRSAAGFLGALTLAVSGYLADDLLVMLAAALVTAVSAAPRVPAAPLPALPLPPSCRRPLALLAAAAVLSFAASAISLADPRMALANYLWLSALALVLAAGLMHDGTDLRDLRLPGRRALAEIAVVAAITLAAFGLRVVDLRNMPPIMHGDEGEMGVIARGILNGVTPPLFEASPFFSLPYVLNYLQAGSIALFGADEFGLRVLSVIAGTLGIPLIYLIGRRGWGIAGGLAAAWLMAVAHMQIHYSRLGFVFIESVVCMLAMMAALTYADDAGERWLPHVLAGLAMALGQYFYFAARVMPIVAAPVLLHLLIMRRATWRQAFVMAAAVLIAFAPLATYFATHLDVFGERVTFVSILRDDNIAHVLGRPGTLTADWLPVLATQFDRNLRLFLRGGDAGGFYFQNVPGLDAVMSVLFWLGLGLAAARPARYHHTALLAWFGLGIVFGGVLTIDAPSAQRLTVMLPTTCLFGALCVAELWQAARSLRIPAPLRPLAATGALIVLAAVLALSTWNNLDIYFHAYANATQGRETILVARLARAAPPGTQIVLLGRPVLFSNHGAIKYLAPGVPFSDPASAAEVTLDPGRGALILAVPDHARDLDAIRAQRPGTLETIKDPLGRLVLLTYRIPGP